MTRNKDLKRLVRTRMRKTGESYTAAHAQLIRSQPGSPDATAVEAAWSARAGMSDDAVHARTGKTWKQWVRSLDALGATGMPHRDIARHLKDVQGLSAWWAQTVTVGYERIRGLRDVRQRRGGRYEAGKTRTLPVALPVLYRAFADGRSRGRWLKSVPWKVRSARPDRSIRLDWTDGTDVELRFTGKSREKSAVSIQHRGLENREAVQESKRFWEDRLTALSEFLSRRR